MTRAQRIEHALTKAFAPDYLAVADDSHKHAGHAGARPEGETHYHVTLVAKAFEGLSRLDRQRKVNAELKSEFETGLHALQITVRAPGE